MDFGTEVFVLSLWILLLSVGFFLWPRFFRPRISLGSRDLELSRWGFIVTSTTLAAGSLWLANFDGLLPGHYYRPWQGLTPSLEVDQHLRSLTALLTSGVVTIISCCEVISRPLGYGLI
jgi:hypothetical protein